MPSTSSLLLASSLRRRQRRFCELACDARCANLVRKVLSHWSWPPQERKLAQETLDEAKRAALEPSARTGTAQPGLTGSSATTMEDKGVVDERPRKKGRIGAGAGQGLVAHGVSAKVQEQGDNNKKAGQAKLNETEKAEQAKREQVAQVKAAGTAPREVAANAQKEMQDTSAQMQDKLAQDLLGRLGICADPKSKGALAHVVGGLMRHQVDTVKGRDFNKVWRGAESLEGTVALAAASGPRVRLWRPKADRGRGSAFCYNPRARAGPGSLAAGSSWRRAAPGIAILVFASHRLLQVTHDAGPLML